VRDLHQNVKADCLLYVQENAKRELRRRFGAQRSDPTREGLNWVKTIVLREERCQMGVLFLIWGSEKIEISKASMKIKSRKGKPEEVVSAQ